MTTDDKIKITMSERRPLTVSKQEWPIVARADWHDGQVECQANNERHIRVREHRDGRRLVYGYQCAGYGGQSAGTRNPGGGFLVSPVPGPDVDGKRVGVPDEEETVRAIRRIGGIIDDDRLADECIANLPAEELDAPGRDETDAATEIARIKQVDGTTRVRGYDPVQS